MWIQRDDAFEGIVSKAVFAKAQQLVAARALRMTDEEMLDSLRRLWAKHGRLTAPLINHDRATPCVAAFMKRFKYLTKAYDLIGYKASRNYRYAVAIPQLNQHLCDLSSLITVTLRSHGATVQEQGAINLLLVNDQVSIAVKVCYCNETRSGPRWYVHLDRRPQPDVTIAARLKSGNADILDYYLFPSVDRLTRRLSLTAENEQALDVYRFDSLDAFLMLAKRNLVHKS
jgi:hypothetical protein